MTRQLSQLGHDVRPIPAMYVKPYIKWGKSDAVDAAAICEAVTRPTMRFVAIKSEEQQGVLFLHRAHDLIVRQRTQLSNMLRGLLSEFGIVIAQGIGSAIKFAKGVLQGNKPGIPEVAIDVLSNLSNQLVSLHLRVRWYEMRMHIQARQDPRVMLLRAIPGVGPVTASAAMPFVQPCAGLVVGKRCATSIPWPVRPHAPSAMSLSTPGNLKSGMEAMMAADKAAFSTPHSVLRTTAAAPMGLLTILVYGLLVLDPLNQKRSMTVPLLCLIYDEDSCPIC